MCYLNDMVFEPSMVWFGLFEADVCVACHLTSATLRSRAQAKHRFSFPVMMIEHGAPPLIFLILEDWFGRFLGSGSERGEVWRSLVGI